MDWYIGLIGSVSIGGLAYWKRSLSLSGMIMAIILGTLLYGLGSFRWALLMVVFFISSSVLSKWKSHLKKSMEEHYEKTSCRDALQVVANGAIGVLLCWLHVLFPNDIWYIIFLGVMATVAADTWATEIGGTSKQIPVSIISMKKVPHGTSGGITLRGLTGSLLGSFCIGITAEIIYFWQPALEGKAPFGILTFISIVSGVAGALVDSFIGATWQRMYQCPVCNKKIEVSYHCNVNSSHVQGVSWMNNDFVNAISSCAGGCAAYILSMILY